MTIVRADKNGLALADRALDEGTAVVVALPPPRAFVVAGRDAAAVNLAKRRPAGQPVGSAVADFNLVAPHIDLDEYSFALASWLANDELLNLFLPLRSNAPAWMEPSTSEGWAGITLAPPDPIRALWAGREHLYVSSANQTGGAVATTSAAANAAFGDELLVIDDGRERNPSPASGSAAIVRVGADSQLELVRHGINDANFDGDTNGYLRALLRRWHAHGQ